MDNPAEDFLKTVRDSQPKFKSREEAFAFWKREAAEITEQERIQYMERHYLYSCRLTAISKGYSDLPNHIPNLIDCLEGNCALNSASEAIAKAADALSRKNAALAIRYYNEWKDKYPRILELKTTFVVNTYRVDENAAEPPRDEDDLTETETCYIANEYDIRNDFLEGYMAFLTWGARLAKKYPELGFKHWIAAIRLLKKTSDQNSGDGMSKKDAKAIVDETAAALHDLEILAHLDEECAEGTKPKAVNNRFFIAEEGLMGISSIRLPQEHDEETDEDWIINHNHETIRNRIVIEYTEDDGLSLRDPLKCPKPKGKRFNYPSLCLARKRGVPDPRFHAITLMLKALVEGDRATCRAEKGEEWSKLFQATQGDDPKDGRKATAYRFKTEQIIALKDKKHKFTGEWRFMTRSEQKAKLAQRKKGLS